MRRAIIGITCLVLIAGALILAGQPRGLGPTLRVPEEHGWIVSAEPSAPFTDGLELLEFEGDGTVEIRDVRFEGDPEIELVDALLAPPEARRYAAVQFDPSFPPEGEDFGDVEAFHRAVGHVITTRAPTDGDELYGHQLVLGVRVNGPAGKYQRSAVILDYLSNGHLLTSRIPAELIVCVDLEVSDDDLDCAWE